MDKHQQEVDLIRERCLQAIEGTLSPDSLGRCITVRFLCSKMGITTYTYYQIKSKKSRRLTINEVFAIAEATGTPVCELLGCNVKCKE